MKKNFLLIIIISLMFVLCITTVKAEETYLPADVPNNAYIIGTHMFTRTGSSEYDGTLTTQYIMRASHSIMTSDLDEYIIYYKGRNGWVNAINDTQVTPPAEGFYIEFIDEIEVGEQLPDIPTPTIAEGIGTYYNMQIGITNAEGYCFDECGENQVHVDGYEVYTHANGAYTLLAAGPDRQNPVSMIISDTSVQVLPNEVKSFAIRVYRYNQGQKEYSEYSNDVTLDATIPIPEFRLDQGEFGPTIAYVDNEHRMADVSINYLTGTDPDYHNIFDPNEIYIQGDYDTILADGYEIYEVDTTTPVNENIAGIEEHHAITETNGTYKTYYVRAVKIKNQEIYYSEPSNEVTIHFVATIDKPTEENIYATMTDEYTQRLVGINPIQYCLSNCDDGDIENRNHLVNGFKFYRVTSNGYQEIELPMTDEVPASEYGRFYRMEPNIQEQVVFRAYEILPDNSLNYSPYSDSISLDSTIPAPDLHFDYNTFECNEFEICEIDIGSGTTPNMIFDSYTYLDGDEEVTINYLKAQYVDLFDENGARFIFDSTKDSDAPENSIAIGGSQRKTITFGEKRYARAYIFNSNGEKVYGPASDTITFEMGQ